MQQWQIPAFGIDSLILANRNSISPASLHANEVLVRIHAISLNFRDLMVVEGKYNPRLALPRIPCSDGVGEVVAVGADVQQWKTGDRVAGCFWQNWEDGAPSAAHSKGALGGDIDGVLATEIVLRETGLVRIPDHLNYEEAATLPCAALTAWNALFTATSVKPGDTVLIQGTGGVSIFALQFAKLAGAKVLGISSSDEKLERARTLGLDAGLNYRTSPDWEKWAMEQTAGAGVNLVVEVGGAGTLPRSIRAICHGGVIAQIGVLTGAAEVLDVRPILTKQARIHGVYVGSRAQFIAMNKAISLSGLKPVIDQVFPFTEFPLALRRMESGAHFGKIVISAN
ncbi:zinc-dependent alcohol dehydrogenase family protein [Acidicapsa ligni]|uniref:zinc-dependent alcohol dehydrogenase family protein n=1 Tax=Acidicapsa ligni TaxID=542300 RepID=UPI0021DF72F6|nr:NAD(P)-dependent alcohol dehydrogenase [Acidicapsa ligni]